MKHIFAAAFALVLTCLPALAQERPVVVELYTSQGCSSCPPADAYLHKLAAQEGVLALALHVDYWDYIGWKDKFGNPAWSERQRAYAKVGGRTMVYTPQMVINGVDDVVGNRPKDVQHLIAKHQALPVITQLAAVRGDGSVTVTATAIDAPEGAYLVQLVRYMEQRDVEITRGENAGHTLSYAHIVTHIDTLQDWNGRTPLSVTAPVSSEDPMVVLVQKQGHGEIVAAAHLP